MDVTCITQAADVYAHERSVEAGENVSDNSLIQIRIVCEAMHGAR